MIKVEGSAQRSFAFPADLPLAFTYYSDLDRILTYLPHVYLMRVYGYHQFRVLYSTTELSTYRIRIFADLQAQLDDKKQTLRLIPLDTAPPVESSAGVRSSTVQGFFSIKSTFRRADAQTRINYRLELKADLPTPLALRFMPGYAINRIAHNITKWRIREIADGFIERSIDAFPHWLAEIENSSK